MKVKMEIKGVVYDLEGTLVDSIEAHKAATWKALKSVGITGSDADFEKYFMGKSDLEGFEEICAERGVKADAAKLLSLKQEEYLNAFSQHVKRTGLEELVPELKKKDIRQAVVSGITRKEVEVILDALKLREMLDAYIGVDDVARGKPAPDPYLKACEKLNLLPSGCIVFEDAPSGIKAAKATGCYAIGVTFTHSAGEMKEAGADEVVGNVQEARDVLEEIMKE